VIFDISEDMKAAARTSFDKRFRDGIDSAPLRAADYPCEVVSFGQFSYLQTNWLSFLGY
jgi:hypothetical protein